MTLNRNGSENVDRNDDVDKIRSSITDKRSSLVDSVEVRTTLSYVNQIKDDVLPGASNRDSSIDNSQSSNNEKIDKDSSMSNYTDGSLDLNDLNLEQISKLQRNDPVLKFVCSWFEDNEKPDWNTISEHKTEVKYYWYRWQSLTMTNNVLYRKWENEEKQTCRLLYQSH